MKLKRENRQRPRRGIVLGIVLICMLAATIIGGAMLSLATIEGVEAGTNTLPVKALYLAEAGCAYGRTWLVEQPFPPADIDPISLGVRALGDGFYSVIIYPDDDNDDSYLKKYEIRGEGRVFNAGDQSLVRACKTLRIALRVESFAKFAYFTQDEYNPDIGATIWFFDGDVLNGPVHSNSRMNICGSPVFEGLVSSTAESFNFYHGGPPVDNPDFRDGYELEAPDCDMDRVKNLARLEAAAVSGGLKLICQRARIIFNPDGTMSYRYYADGAWSAWETRPLPGNGVIYIKGHAIVSGVLNGRVTVATTANKDILLPADMCYQTDPSDPACDDMLGLVAGRSVTVTKNSPAGADVTIHASVMAFDKSFGVKDYAHIPVMGALNVYGGIIQKYRGPVGTFYASSGQMASGYAKNYRYDVRMRLESPPYFPATGRYEQISWSEDATQLIH